MSDKPKKKKVGAHDHVVRTQDRGFRRVKIGRRDSMAMMCTECLGWEGNPRDCTAVLCPLYPFRIRTQLNNHRDDDLGKDAYEDAKALSKRFDAARVGDDPQDHAQSDSMVE